MASCWLRAARAGARGWTLALVTACSPGQVQEQPERAPPPDAARDLGDAPTGADRPADLPDDLPADLPGGLLCARAGGSSFESLDWVPADAKLAVALELADADFEAALARLVAGAGARDDLPIVSGMALSQLPLQLSIMRTTLTRGGFAPATLILLHTPANEPVWVLRAPCDLDRMRAEIERRWAVQTRSVVGGVVGERDPARAASAHVGDVLFVSGDRVAITPSGAGARLLKWLEGQTPTTPDSLLGPGAPSPAARGPGLDAIARAPVRVMLQGPGLLAIGAGPSEGRVATSGPIALRATAATLERVTLAPEG